MQAEVLSELVERLNQIASVVNRLEQAGELPRIEARLFGIEAATRASEVRELAATAIDLELQIKAILGLRPESQLNLVPLVSINLPESADEHTLAEANATLLARRAEYEVAERNVELEIRKQYPDLSIGPAYENEEDQSRIGFSGAFPIPLWNRNRKGIAEAEAERESARIAFETEYETVVSQHARAGREYELRKQMREELESTLIPLVEDQLRDAQRMIELGEMNSLVQLESVVGRAEAKLLKRRWRLSDEPAQHTSDRSVRIDLGRLLWQFRAAQQCGRSCAACAHRHQPH
jgi:outer membrane protein TolC